MMFKAVIIFITALLPALFSNPVYGGGGGAGSSKDDVFIYVAVIMFLGLLLGILFLIRFIRKRWDKKESSPDEISD